jgi:hypothetical protein
MTRAKRPVVAILVTLAIVIVGAVAAAAVTIRASAGFQERFESDDPYQVVTAYYEARSRNMRETADQALDPAALDARYVPGYVDPLIDDVFLAGNLIVQGPNDYSAYGTHDEEVQFVVTYDSRWQNAIGQPPGGRHWFVYLGRNADGRWYVLGEGTGPWRPVGEAR